MLCVATSNECQFSVYENTRYFCETWINGTHEWKMFILHIFNEHRTCLVGIGEIKTKKKHDERHERIHTPAAMRVKGGHYGIHYILLLGKGFNS